MNVSFADDDTTSLNRSHFRQDSRVEESGGSRSSTPLSSDNDSIGRLVPGDDRPSSAESGAGDRHGRLLLTALLENFCKLYESNPRRSERLFSVLCKTLSSMGILDQEHVVELAGVRLQYSRAFKQLMLRAKEAVDSEDRLTATASTDTLQCVRRALGSGDSSEEDSTNDHDAHDRDKDKDDIFNLGSSGNRLSLAEWLGYEDSKYHSEFQELRLLGKGGFGAVYQCRHRLDEKEYAVKKIVLKSSSLNQAKVYREIKTLARLEHPNVIRYFSSWLEHSGTSCRSALQPSLRRNFQTIEHDQANNGTGMLFLMDTEDPSFSTRDVSEEEQDDSGDIVFETPDHDEVEENDAISDMFFEQRLLGDRQSRLRHDSRSSGGTDLSAQTQSTMAVSPEQASSMPSTSHIRRRTLSSTIQELPRYNDSIFSASLPHHQGKYNRRRRRKSDSSVGLTLFIQMHLCPTTLRDHIRSRNRAYCDMESVRERLSSQSYIGLFRAILEGTNHVHRSGLCHRDIKPSNIFLSEVGQADPGAVGLIDLASDQIVWVIPKLGDFGLVLPTGGDRNADSDEEDGVGTAIYGAPEQFSRTIPTQMTSKCDVFALGIVFFEMLHFSTNTAMERSKLLEDLRHGILPEEFVQCHPAESAVILAMTCDNPTSRPSIEEILEMEILVTAEEKEKHHELFRIKQENAELKKRIKELEGLALKGDTDTAA